jgi:hypothetical protein
MDRQGPHHGAQKSTSTGIWLRATCFSKRAPDSSSGAPVNSSLPQVPHTGPCASLASGTRFTASQCGQTMWRASTGAALDWEEFGMVILEKIGFSD